VTNSKPKPKLLFLCHRIPFPPNKGDKIRSFNLLDQLSNDFTVYLGAFIDDQDDWRWTDTVKQYCEECLFLPLNPTWARMVSLAGFFTNTALSVPYYRSRKMQRWVDHVARDTGIDRVLVFSSAMSQYVSNSRQSFAHKVVDYVDVDSDKWMQYAETRSWPLNWIYRREGRLLLKFDQAIIGQFDAGYFVSSSEAELFKSLAPQAARKIHYFNNGVNADYFTAEPDRANPYQEGDSVLVFTGAMDYWPNIDAVTWFATEVFPVIRKRHPEVQFYIVGSNPAAEVVALGSIDGVRVTGRVEDVRPYQQYALAMVAPMRVARGVQNKVLEGMSMSKPVLVSAKGLEGINCDHQHHVLLAENPKQYADLVEQLLRGEFVSLGENARTYIQQYYNWQKNLAQISSSFQVGGDNS